MGFRVIPEASHISLQDGRLAHVNFKALLDNGDLIYVAVVFERGASGWRLVRVNTLCCGEH
jgi:hypothetical protein